jgi:predicted nucleic acid-binding protein
MRTEVLLDTGPLVAFLNRRDQHHQWAMSQWREIAPPLLTNESVLSESIFLIEQAGGHSDMVLDLVARQIVHPAFSLSDHVEEVRKLLRKYRHVPMSLADSCLVRMSEVMSCGTIFTLDGDFRVYRRHGRKSIPLLRPV